MGLMAVQTKADADEDYSAEGDENYQDSMELDYFPPFDGTTVAPDDFGALDPRSPPASWRGILQFGYDNNRNKKIIHLTDNATQGGLVVIRPTGYKKTFITTRNRNDHVENSGTCCVKLYTRRRYQGISQELEVGHSGGLNFSKIRSLKWGVCSQI